MANLQFITEDNKKGNRNKRAKNNQKIINKMAIVSFYLSILFQM